MCRILLQASYYNWSSLTNSDISNHYISYALPEISERHTTNDKFENFITAHKETAAECILTKPRAKCRVPWKPIAVREKDII